MDEEEVPRKRRRLSSTAAAHSSHRPIDGTDHSADPKLHTRMATDDEAYARHLQAELDAEHGHAGPPPVPSSSSLYTAPVPRSHYPEPDDEEVARRLQAHFDLDQAPDMNSSHNHNSSSSSTYSPSLSLDGTPITLTPLPAPPPTIAARHVEKTLRTLYQSMKTHQCHYCTSRLFEYENDVIRLFDALMGQPTQSVSRGIVCPDCQSLSRTQSDRLVLIWVLLCGFDHSSTHNKPDKDRRSSRQTGPQSTVKGNGVGYGGKARQHHTHDTLHAMYGFGLDATESDDAQPHQLVGHPSTAAPGYLGYHYGPPPAAQKPAAQKPAGKKQKPLGPLSVEQYLAAPPGYHQASHKGKVAADPDELAAALNHYLAGGQGPYTHPSKPSPGTDLLRPSHAPAKPTEPVEEKLSRDDRMTARVLKCLTHLLPSVEKEGEFDTNPPGEQLECVLLGSSILERAADLFRNNNLEEVTNQAELYTALVRFIQTLSQHPATSALALRERVARSPGVSILQVSFGKTELVSTEESDTTQSLTRCMRALALQCKIMLRSPEISRAHMKVLHTIDELNKLLTANAGVDMTKSTDKNLWQKELAVSEIADEAIIPKHSLAGKQSPLFQSPPGRMSRIMQELARLQSSLPDGIFVRYASTRPDIMKFLITGPRDTPYENGLFEFDMLCGPKFPQEPPQVEFRTTGGGWVEFNPNLYASGKVCLSLLGTWPGESWNPKKSTLLQVLVSIQAMIFCDHPYNNEPGRENVPHHDVRSKSYNRSLYHRTIQTAMLDWLDRRRYRADLPDHSGPSAYYWGDNMPVDGVLAKPSGTIDDTEDIWDEVVKKHFEMTAEEIVVTVTKWIADKPAPGEPKPRRFTMASPTPELAAAMWGVLGGTGGKWGTEPVTPNHAPAPAPAPHAPPLSPADFNFPKLSTLPTPGGIMGPGGKLENIEPQKGLISKAMENVKVPELVGDNLAAKLRDAVAILKGCSMRH